MSFSCGQKYTKDVQICCPENSYTSPKNLNVDPKKWVGKMMFSVELPHVNFCFANALIQGPSFKKPKRDSLSYWVFLQMLPSTTFSDSSETYAVFFNHVFFCGIHPFHMLRRGEAIRLRPSGAHEQRQLRHALRRCASCSRLWRGCEAGTHWCWDERRAAKHTLVDEVHLYWLILPNM